MEEVNSGCPAVCRSQTSCNQKVDDADSLLPRHQPIRRTSTSWSHFVWAIMIKLLTTPSRLGHTVLRVLARCGPTLPRKAIKLFFLLHPKLCLWELIWCQDIDFPGFPGGSDCKVSACNVGDPGSIPGSGRSLGGRWQPTSVFLPGESHGQRSLVDYSPWSHKESDTTERLTLSHFQDIEAGLSFTPTLYQAPFWSWGIWWQGRQYSCLYKFRL